MFLIAAVGKSLGGLDGAPIAIKSNFCIKGHRATAGSPMLQQFVAPYTATVVERLQEAGAVIIGTTNMDEFGMGYTLILLSLLTDITVLLMLTLYMDQY